MMTINVNGLGFETSIKPNGHVHMEYLTFAKSQSSMTQVYDKMIFNLNALFYIRFWCRGHHSAISIANNL